MDDKLEKAVKVANYMATLTNQKRIALEEFKQNIIYYHSGASFTANRELINFVKTLVDLKNESAVLLDDNYIPVEISNLSDFLTQLIELYTESSNKYLVKYSELKSKRRVEDLVKL